LGALRRRGPDPRAGRQWEEALEKYRAQADDLHAGRRPRVNWDGLTIKELGERFCAAKYSKLSSGELGVRMFQDYREVCQLLADVFGITRPVEDLRADDFEKLRSTMAERWGPVRVANAITRIKSVFKYALDNGLLDNPVRYGSELKKPGKTVLRKHKATNGAKMIEAPELRRLLDAAGVPLRAMILLGLNCGFGNHDCGSLSLSALDLDAGWNDFPRPKTGINRRCPLWPETVAALRETLVQRPELKIEGDAEIVFLWANGRRWVRDTEKSRRDYVSGQFGKLQKRLGLHRL
jgi:integrase